MKRQVDWTPFLFLILTPLIALITLPIYFYYVDVTWPIVVLTVFYIFATGMSITGGYHRLFSHRTYESGPLMKALYLFFGAATFQNSALVWSINHRQHHRKVDSDDDPYSIQKGALFAHIGWMLFKNPATQFSEVPRDLKQDAMIQFQHKYYLPIAIFSCFLLPAGIGYLLGDFWGGLLLAGLGRMVLVHHTTFFVNSLAHMWGSQPYTNTNSAKDNFIVALLTYGEGYHNFHHYFEADYRNGIRWYQYDPTKWMIQGLAQMGLVKNLKVVPEEKILLAKMNMQRLHLHSKGVDVSRLDALREKFIAAQKRAKELAREYEIRKNEFQDRSRDQLQQLKLELRLAKIEMRATMKQWHAAWDILKNQNPAMA